jgi:hypothetical protein
MSVIEPPLINRSNFSPSDEETDGLLRSFFQGELPRPWPVLEPPAGAVMPLSSPESTRSGALSRSRVVLAASVAFLVGGQALLSHALQTDGSASPGTSAPVDLMARPDRHGKTSHGTTSGPGPVSETGPRAAPVKPMR